MESLPKEALRLCTFGHIDNAYAKQKDDHSLGHNSLSEAVAKVALSLEQL